MIDRRGFLDTLRALVPAAWLGTKLEPEVDGRLRNLELDRRCPLPVSGDDTVRPEHSVAIGCWVSATPSPSTTVRLGTWATSPVDSAHG